MKRLIELEPGILSAENLLYQLQTVKNVIFKNKVSGETFLVRDVYVPKGFKSEHAVLINVTFWREDATYQSHIVYEPIIIEYTVILQDNIISCVGDNAVLGAQLLSSLIDIILV